MQYSVVKYSQLEETSIRLDAEFYKPYFLAIEKKIKQQKWDYLKNLSSRIKSFGAYSLCNQVAYQPMGIPFLRCKDIQDGLIDFSDVLYIDDKTNKLLWKSEVKPNTILFTMSGTVGNTAIATQELNYPINSNQDIAKITANNKLNPYYLTIFLNCSFGQTQIFRLPIGSIQQHIFLWQLEKLEIPIFSFNFQEIIEKVFQKSLACKSKSIDLYKQAEQFLLSELNLSTWKPIHKLAFIKNFSTTHRAERIDAEYFQPKYEKIVEVVKAYKGGFDELGNLVKIKDKNFTPKDNEQYKYIELANILSNGEINGYMENFGKELPSRARRKAQKGDVIISSIEGSLESIALITEDWENALCSTGFFAVNSDKINSETLLVLLKTKVGQLQLKKGCKGTILTAIGKDELSKIVLPKVDSEIQKQIKEHIFKMYETKKLSRSLLEIAKRSVEMAIEKNEAGSEKWIKNQLEKLDVSL